MRFSSALVLPAGGPSAFNWSAMFTSSNPGCFTAPHQLNGQKLADVMDAYGIKSVINLRGEK